MNVTYHDFDPHEYIFENHGEVVKERLVVHTILGWVGKELGKVRA